MDFVIIANAWAAGQDNPTSKHRIALELARRGHRVLWIEAAGMRRPQIGSSADRSKMWLRVKRGLAPARKTDKAGIWVLSPLFVPLPSLGFVRWFNGMLCYLRARFECRRLGFRDAVLINYVPVLGHVMAMWKRGKRQGARGKRGNGEEVGGKGQGVRWEGRPGWLNTSSRPTLSEARRASPCVTPLDASSSPATNNCLTIYHCVDKWDAFAMYNSGVMAAMDRLCCLKADHVIASSRALYDHCLTLNPRTSLITHGVDYEMFSAAGPLNIPGDLPPAPVVGFIGLISEWVDQDLLRKLASRLPEVNFVLIGRADVATDALKNIPNIHLLGPRPFADLPRYLSVFKAGLIPFVVNELTRAVNPIKLREMLAAGVPVVSTALPEVAAVGRGKGQEGRGKGEGVRGEGKEGKGEEVGSGKEGEGRVQGSGFRCQRTEDRGQKAEDRVQMPDSSAPVTHNSSLITHHSSLVRTRGIIVAENHDEFIDAVRELVTHPLSIEERASLRASMKDESWERKVDEIVGIVNEGGGVRGEG